MTKVLWRKKLPQLMIKNGNYYIEDDGLRRDSSLAKLATLQPFFDKPFGLVTAGNSSQITDGATFLEPTFGKCRSN